jgi:hypothetical protein
VRRQHGIEALGRRLSMRAILVMGARGKLDPSASTRSWASTTSILDLVGASQVVRCARGLRGPVRPIARSVKPGYGRSDEPPNRQRYQKRIYFVRLDNEESPLGLRQSNAVFAKNLFRATSADAVKFNSWWIGSRIVRATSVAVAKRVLFSVTSLPRSCGSSRCSTKHKRNPCRNG